MSARLVVLLPVRNGAEDLPGYFAAVAPFADAIVALDDGSTDETRALLEAEPLVQVLLTNPVRTDDRDWDDAENRNRLLQAAAALQPDWVISLDADERFDPDDAFALHRFIDEQALPGCAHGFQIFRMVGDSGHYDLEGPWVYRLFAWEEGQCFPEQRLHFVPVPSTIPPALWVRTTLRIQHLAGSTPERREARFKKYQQADPNGDDQHPNRDLLTKPASIRAWRPRLPDMPILAPRADNDEGDAAAGDLPPDHLLPVLSAIIISRNDETRIARTVSSVVNQECPWPFETIVVTSGTDRTAAIVREQFPDVTLIELTRSALPGEARNVGLKVARGAYVTFIEAQGEVPPGSFAARARAHRSGYAMVTGTTLPGTKTRAGWAAYFLDHATNLPGRPAMELTDAPTHCSYNREALLTVDGFPEELRAGEETVVNQRLFEEGYIPYFSNEISILDYSPCRTFGSLLKHQFTRGRGFGQILLARRRFQGRLLTKRELRLLLYERAVWQLGKIRDLVTTWGDEMQPEFRRAYPYVVAGVAAASAGTLYEVLRPVRGQGKLLILFGRPVLTIVLAGLDRWHGDVAGNSDLLMVVRIDLIAKRIKIVSIPRDLYIEIPGFGERKINAAFNLGAGANPDDPNAGARLLRTTIEQRFGIRTDDHVVIEFHGFRRLIDALGGVTVDVPRTIHDDRYPNPENENETTCLHVEAGRQRMDGDLALKYVRTRMTDNDVYRRGRQIDVAKAMLRSAQALRSPRQIVRAFRVGNSILQTSFTPVRKLLLATTGFQIKQDAIESTRLAPPLIEEDRTESGAFIYSGDLQTVATFIQANLDLEEPTYRLSKPSTVRTDGPNQQRRG